MHRLGYALVRRAGRRLGRAGRDADRRARPASTARPSTSTCRSRSPPEGTASRSPTRNRPISPRFKQFQTRGVGVRARAGDEAADARRRAQRLPRRPARVDRREVPRVERLRRRPRERLHARSAAHQRDALLGDTHDRVVGAAVPGVATGATWAATGPQYVGVPTGVARYPKEVLRTRVRGSSSTTT